MFGAIWRWFWWSAGGDSGAVIPPNVNRVVFTGTVVTRRVVTGTVVTRREVTGSVCTRREFEES